MRETTDAMHPTHPRRRPWPTVLLLVVTALLLALFAVVLVAPPAGAHSLGGVEPGNYRAPADEERFPAARQREPAAAHSTLATVLPWPGPRRSGDNLDDPDLPGGA